MVETHLPTGEKKSFPLLRVKGGRLYFRLRDPTDPTLKKSSGWFWQSTAPSRKQRGLPAGCEEEAERVRKAAQQLLDTKRALGLRTARRMTVGGFFSSWTDDIEKRGVVTPRELKKRRQVFRDYSAELAVMTIQDVTYQQVSDWNASLKGRVLRGERAARTALHAVHYLSQVFNRAVRLGLIKTNPFQLLEAKERIQLEDKDPEWRDGAYFEIAEVEQLISDERIEFADRVTWAFCFFLACRPNEMERVRWNAYQPEFEPMPKLLLHRPKVRRVSPCPVHPTLASMLAEWKLHGWEETVGRPPKLDDFIFPIPIQTTRNGRNHAPGSQRGKDYTWRRMQRTFEAIPGLRRRRVYDLRRSLITLAVNEWDCNESVLKTMTHPGKKDGGAFDLYKSKNFRVLCREISKVKVFRRVRGELVRLPLAMASGSNSPSEESLGTTLGLLKPTTENQEEKGMHEEGLEGARGLGKLVQSSVIGRPGSSSLEGLQQNTPSLGAVLPLQNVRPGHKVPNTVEAAVARLRSRFAAILAEDAGARRDFKLLVRKASGEDQ